MKVLLYLIIILISLGQIAQAGIRVSPAQIDLTLDQEEAIVPIIVTNTTDASLSVQTRIHGVSQQIDKGLVFEESLGGIYDGARYIKLEPPNLTLGPGESQEIRAHFYKPLTYDWQGGLYAVILFEYGVSGKEKISSSIGVFTRVVSPHGLKQEGKITRVKVVQSELETPIEIYAAFQNTGNIHLHLKGKTLVRDEDGNLVARVGMSEATIFPGGEGWLKGIWYPPILPVGDYSVQCVTYSEGKEVSVSGQAVFAVLAPYKLKKKTAEIMDFPQVEAVLRRSAPFALVVRNSGNTAMEIGGNLEIYNEAGGLVAVLPLTTKKIDADKTAQLSGVLEEDLPVAEYKVVAKLVHGNPEPASKATKFKVIEQEIIRDGKIVKFVVQVMSSRKPIVSTLILENEGNVPLVFGGIIEIKKGGKVLKTARFATTTVEPKKQEEVKISLKDNFPIGLYEARAKLSYGKNLFATASTNFFIK